MSCTHSESVEVGLNNGCVGVIKDGLDDSEMDAGLMKKGDEVALKETKKEGGDFMHYNCWLSNQI